jgi:NADH:ubiquinone oxidoreductase subunit D
LLDRGLVASRLLCHISRATNLSVRHEHYRGYVFADLPAIVGSLEIVMGDGSLH